MHNEPQIGADDTELPTKARVRSPHAADERMARLGLPREAAHEFELALMEALPADVLEQDLAFLRRTAPRQERRTDRTGNHSVLPQKPALTSVPSSRPQPRTQRERQLGFAGDDWLPQLKLQALSTPDGLRRLHAAQVTAGALGFLANAMASLLFANVVAFLQATLLSTRPNGTARMPELTRIVLGLNPSEETGFVALHESGVRKLVVTPTPRSPNPRASTPSCYAFVVEEAIPAPPVGARLEFDLGDRLVLVLDFSTSLPTELSQRHGVGVRARAVDIKDGTISENEQQQAILARYLALLIRVTHWLFQETIGDSPIPWWRQQQEVFIVPPLHVNVLNRDRENLEPALRPFLRCLSFATSGSPDTDGFIASMMLATADGAALHQIVETKGFEATARERIILHGPDGPNKAGWGITGRSHERRQQIISRDARTDPRILDKELEGVNQSGVTQAMAVPLVVGRMIPPSSTPSPPYAEDLDERLPSHGGRHYHDYGALYSGLTSDLATYEPEHVLFARHLGVVLAHYLGCMDLQAKRDELVQASIDIGYHNLLAWVDADYFWPHSSLAKDLVTWVYSADEERSAPAEPGLKKDCIAFIAVHIDQEETLFHDLGGDLELAVANASLRRLVAHIAEDYPAESSVSNYQHGVLLTLRDCPLEVAWLIADSIRKRLNLGSDLPSWQAPAGALTVSCLLWASHVSHLRDLKLGRTTGGGSQRNDFTALNIVLRRLKKAYDVRRRARLAEQPEEGRYPAVAEILWVDPAAPQNIRNDYPGADPAAKLLPFSLKNLSA